MVNLFINEIQVGLWLTKVKSFSFFVWWNIKSKLNKYEMSHEQVNTDFNEKLRI